MIEIGVASVGGPRRLGAREVWFWAILLVGVAYWVNIVRASVVNGPFALRAVIDGVLDNGAFDLFAWTLVFARATKLAEDAPATRPQILATFMLGVLVLAPTRVVSAIALAILGSLLLAGRRSSTAGRQVGFVLVALAIETVWTSPLLASFHLLVGQIDARLGAFILRNMGYTIIVEGNVLENVTSGFSIAIWPFCTSSLQLAGVCVAFLVVVIYRGKLFKYAHLPWLVLACASSALLTEIRLALLAESPIAFEWWHHGPGVSIYALIALGSAVVFPILATRHEQQDCGTDTTRLLT